MAVATQQIVGAPAAQQPSYPMASLYVGDLHPDVTEALLFEKFSLAGPVLSIRVCRDTATRRSLGYAYVNFQQPADAERALDTMNFDPIHGRPMRIMWSQRDPSLRKSGAGNIFIKNLDKTIDNKAIHDTFSTFGTILSCKVAIDEKGESRGYGFVHFDSEAAAKSAIEKVNGMLLNGKKVFAGPFQPRQNRMKELGESRKFTNVYIKNFGTEMTEEKLHTMCEKFGEILSVAVPLDDETKKSKGYGFVSFKLPESAEKCVAELNELEYERPEDGGEKESETKPKLYVGRAQKKGERQAELRRKYEEMKAQRDQRYQGVNLYVKNLADSIDDKELEKLFSDFGAIQSAKVMVNEEGRSKGFGFVSFVDPENATKAVTDMNGKHIVGKPLYVAIAQRKEDRRAQLASQYMQRLAQMRMNTGMPSGMYTPAMAGVGFGGQNAFAQAPRPGFMPPMGMAAAAQFPRQMQPAQWSRMSMPQYAGYTNAQTAPMAAMNQQQQYMRSAPQAQVRPMTGMAGAAGGMQTRVQAQPMAATQMMGQRTMGPQTAQMRPQMAGMQRPQMANAQNAQMMMRANGYKPSGYGRPEGDYEEQGNLASELAKAGPQEQKQVIGERIYPKVQEILARTYHTKPGFDREMCSDGKVTGMLLEMDNSELLMLLDDHELLNTKVNEAVRVLMDERNKH